ncbi:MAG: DNA-binding response regulator [Geobacteraceae bacterium GWC2_58_44]|nr:MAG: DNA-binding response regulator [Geobacteraceae bacterium GWC2_58_44]HBG03984.1 DNA-binding response regulator [Geobacter sp.]
MKILLVDDHAIVRKGIAQLLASAKAEVDEASSCPEALARVARKDYDIVLLDISMPGINGLETLKLLRHDRPKLPVLILTMYPEEQYAIRAMKSGASGYLTKGCNPKELHAAIGKIIKGGKYVSATLLEIFTEELTKDFTNGKAHLDHLSDREYQIARFIANGKTVGQIAGEINLSVNTISTYRMRVLTKLSMKTNAELTAYMIREGLID